MRRWDGGGGEDEFCKKTTPPPDTPNTLFGTRKPISRE